MSTGIRKIAFHDYMHYQTAVSFFDNTTTAVWTAPAANGWNAWDSTFGGSEAIGSNYIQPGQPAGSPDYLYAQATWTPGRSLSMDFSLKFDDGADDAGIYFMSATNALDQDSYRVRQSGPNVLVERMSGGSVVWTETYPYAPDPEWNHYRVHFYPQNYEFGDGEVLASCAGSFLVFAGADLESISQLTPAGTGVDPSPRTTGTYFGIYQGPASRPQVGAFVMGEDFYPLKKFLHVEHSLKGMSTAHMRVMRSEYVEWGHWSAGDLVQIWAWDVDDSENYEQYLDFFGEVVTNYQQTRGEGDQEIDIFMISPLIKTNIVESTAPAAGLLTGHIEQITETPEGSHWAGMTNGQGIPRWINNLFVKDGYVSVSSGRTFRNRKKWEIVKQIALADDFYVWYTPEGAWKVTDVWRDMRSIWIDTGNDPRFVDYKAWPSDLNQTVNKKVGVRSGGNVSTTPAPNAASLAAYGERHGPEAAYIDMQVEDAAEMEAITQTIHDNNYHDQAVIELYFLGKYMQLRPGDLVQVSVPQLRIGGDYDTEFGQWSPETYGILEKRWDSEGCIVALRMAPTRFKEGEEVPATPVGNQDFQLGVRGWSHRTRHQADFAQSNQT